MKYKVVSAYEFEGKLYHTREEMIHDNNFLTLISQCQSRISIMKNSLSYLEAFIINRTDFIKNHKFTNKKEKYGFLHEFYSAKIRRYDLIYSLKAEKAYYYELLSEAKIKGYDSDNRFVRED